MPQSEQGTVRAGKTQINESTATDDMTGKLQFVEKLYNVLQKCPRQHIQTSRTHTAGEGSVTGRT